MEAQIQKVIDRNAGTYGKMLIEGANLDLSLIEIGPNYYSSERFQKGIEIEVNRKEGFNIVVINVLNDDKSGNRYQICTFETEDSIRIESRFNSSEAKVKIDVYDDSVALLYYKDGVYAMTIHPNFFKELVYNDPFVEGDSNSENALTDNTMEQLLNRLYGVYKKALEIQGYSDAKTIEESFKFIESVLGVAIYDIFIRPWKSDIAYSRTIKQQSIKSLNKAYQEYFRNYCEQRARILEFMSHDESNLERFTK